MLDVASVAKRARGENFPVASLAFPRELRPHIRALYAYARLVDILGDELEGGAEARLTALDELELEVDAAFRGAATWPVLVELQPTIREFDLPREPFLRLIEANRMDQRVSEYETWDDLKHYCVHSADPCGRLVLGVLRRGDRIGGRDRGWPRSRAEDAGSGSEADADGRILPVAEPRGRGNGPRAGVPAGRDHR